MSSPISRDTRSPSIPPAVQWRDSAVSGFESRHKHEQWEDEHPGQKHPFDLLMALDLVPKSTADLDWADVTKIEELLTGISTPSEVPLDSIRQIKRLIKGRASESEPSLESLEDGSPSELLEGTKDGSPSELSEGTEDDDDEAHTERPKSRKSSVSSVETDYDYDQAGRTAHILFGSQENVEDKADKIRNFMSSPASEPCNQVEEGVTARKSLATSSPSSNLRNLADEKEVISSGGTSTASRTAQIQRQRVRCDGKGKRKRDVGTMTCQCGAVERHVEKRRKMTILIEISEHPISVRVFSDPE
ncbi:hypothetical protein AGABI1DRAFT_95730 [Agaricus bisporus var. burnettii JB137-S8]|uniref:Uncharacterized protein n=1 Tax=Agaricus bisporus var. burnettii (strain JB137-S8 / ATCC MYA-4627 / FGSC 10392) TaxID=597362 RepID=K5WU70_AGABU|nr:uncharacterized protein AGABI1DRAFT_95730 [Agaricus bisporus var. burnettii JB137-S8]EKM74303.1 hypothetical protein AGABI1DRAFT_95730 [Agaricus bisporus var. burnettii JB137-S8]